MSFDTKDAGRGTGLGLAFAKRIVERVGGRITFDSIEGVGSTLRIFLPVINDEESLLR
jgi:signal transduction histidine kinase